MQIAMLYRSQNPNQWDKHLLLHLALKAHGCKRLTTTTSETFTQAPATHTIQPSENTARLSNRLHDMAPEIVVAVIGGCFLVLVALIGKIGSDNKKDHGQVHQTLGRIEQKIDGHIEGHQ